MYQIACFLLVEAQNSPTTAAGALTMQKVGIVEKSLRNLINEARVLALAARQNLAPRRIEGGGEIRTEGPDAVRIKSGGDIHI
jgi:hypothetical protein